MATSKLGQLQEQKIKKLELELAALKAATKTAKVEAHAAEIKATVMLNEWFTTTTAGKASAKRHFQTSMKTAYAVKVGGYIGSWAFDIAKADGYKG